MSSTRKDARWHLATTMAEAAGIDGYSGVSNYPVWEAILTAADRLMDQLSEEQIQVLADRWTERSTAEETKARDDYAGTALLRVWLIGHIDRGEPMLGDPGEAYVEVLTTDVLELELVEEWKELAIATAELSEIGESDDHPTAVLTQAIADLAPHLSEDELPERGPAFTLIFPEIVKRGIADGEEG